jgi:hypothetical protein
MKKKGRKIIYIIETNCSVKDIFLLYDMMEIYALIIFFVYLDYDYIVWHSTARA